MDRTVTVTGQGSAQVVPDTAVVRLAAGHRAADVAQALAGVDDAVGTLGAVARRFTEPRRIQTTELGIWPAYDEAGDRAATRPGTASGSWSPTSASRARC